MSPSSLSVQSVQAREDRRTMIGTFGVQPHADAGIVDLEDGLHDDELNDAQDRVHERLTAEVKGAFPYADTVRLVMERVPNGFEVQFSSAPAPKWRLDEVSQYGQVAWKSGDPWPRARRDECLKGFDPVRMDPELVTSYGRGQVTMKLPYDIREPGSVAGTDPAVANGATAPDVVWSDGRNWFRSDKGGGGEPYGMRIQANRVLSQDEAQQLAQLTGYAYRAAVRGESLGDPEQDTRASIIVQADFTKSRRDDLGDALMDLEEMLPGIVKDGSQVRKTDRAGEGTRGTRLVEGLGGDLQVTIYYDCR